MDHTWIRELPKFDLHVHLDGSMRPDTVMELARKLSEDRKLTPTLGIERALLPPQRCTLEEYLKSFEITVAVLQSEAASNGRPMSCARMRQKRTSSIWRSALPLSSTCNRV